MLGICRRILLLGVGLLIGLAHMPAAAADMLSGALPRVGDRVALALGHRPTAILVYAGWSPPSLVERGILTEVAAQVAPCRPGTPCIQSLYLDADSPAAVDRLRAIGGESVVPFALLVDARGIVMQRYLGWPARNPTRMAAVLRRDLERLLGRSQSVATL